MEEIQQPIKVYVKVNADASKKFNIPRLNKSFKQIAENHWKCGGYYWYYKER